MLDILITNHIAWMYLFLALGSLSIGSLLNLIIFRLPLMIKYEWQQQCCELLQVKKKQKKHPIPFNLFFPRSQCPQCQALISAWQNIPLISYFVLKRRCYHCKQAISIRYPMIECLTMFLSVFACIHFGFSLKLVFVLPALYLLICLIFIDLDHHLLPDSLSLSLLWLGLIANTQHLFCSINEAIFGAVGGYLLLWLFINFYYLITGKRGMGHGDFKLFSAMGAWFGWILLGPMLLIACLSGAVVGLIYLYLNNKPKESHLAFGPFLCITAFVCLFWGNELLLWYLTFF
ncbi:MAG: prepilin peptidase [Legionella sp.]|nr:prepilin peptidase [Legionella sp.]